LYAFLIEAIFSFKLFVADTWSTIRMIWGYWTLWFWAAVTYC